MESLLFSLFFCLAWVACAELPPLRVKFNQIGILYAQESENLKFECEINRNLAYIAAGNEVYIIRKSAIEETEAIVLRYPKNVDKDSNYTIVPHPVPGNGIFINITISKVRDLDEGSFICRVHDNSGTIEEDDLQIQLKKPLKNFYLEFNGKSRISQTRDEPIEEFAGNYSVICIAIGSNPVPSVNLYFNGNEVENGDNQTELLATKLKEYKTTINATIPITFSRSLQEIKCNGTTELEDKHSVAIYVKTKIRDPDVDCNETKAYEGEKHPVLICIIQYEGFNITNFTYADGDHTVLFHDVQIQNLSGTEKRVYLKLDEAKDWHFRDFYLLLTHSDGHITRESVRLHKTAGPSKSPTIVQSLWITLLVPFFPWLILHN